MKIGINYRAVGPQSPGNKITKFLKLAELVVLESVSLLEYIATLLIQPKVCGEIPWSNNVIWMNGGNTQWNLRSTSVLITPYRSKFPTVKSIAAIQDSLGGRCCLGSKLDGWPRHFCTIVLTTIISRKTVSLFCLARNPINHLSILVNQHRG